MHSVVLEMKGAGGVLWSDRLDHMRLRLRLLLRIKGSEG